MSYAGCPGLPRTKHKETATPGSLQTRTTMALFTPKATDDRQTPPPAADSPVTIHTPSSLHPFASIAELSHARPPLILMVDRPRAISSSGVMTFGPHAALRCASLHHSLRFVQLGSPLNLKTNLPMRSPLASGDTLLINLCTRIPSQLITENLNLLLPYQTGMVSLRTWRLVESRLGGLVVESTSTLLVISANS